MTVRIGFLGCGWVSAIHAPNLQTNPDVELVAFCDIVEERATEYAEKFGGRAYTDHHQMMEEEELDAIYIAIPPFAHTDQELLCAQKSIHMFIEKPLALNMETANRIYGYIKGSKVIHCVGYHWRYLPVMERAKELLNGKKVGMVQALWWLAPFPTPWWRIKSKSGGIIIENVTHCFDLLRYMFGEVERVYCESNFCLLKDLSDFNQEDVYVTTLRFKSGLVGCVSNTCGDRHSPREQMFKIFTDKLTLVLRERSLEIWEDNKLTKVAEPEIQNNLLGLYEKEDKIFIDSIKNGNSQHIKSTYEDAMKTLRLTLAIEESAKKQIPVIPSCF